MIVKIRQFFDQHIFASESDSGARTEHQLQLASAALMIEVLYADHTVTQAELDTLQNVLSEAFELEKTDADRLIRLAQEERAEATDYYQFTSLINDHYSQAQKRELVTRLWQLAYADKRIHKFEEHLVRRLADLLHVPHSAFIQSKHKASKKPVARD